MVRKVLKLHSNQSRLEAWAIALLSSGCCQIMETCEEKTIRNIFSAYLSFVFRYISHDTWKSYQSMLRIIKKYKIPFKKVPKGETVPGVEMSFRCCLLHTSL